MLINKAAYKYEIPFKGPFESVQMCTNRIVTLLMGDLTTRMNIRHIKLNYREESEWRSHFNSK